MLITRRGNQIVANFDKRIRPPLPKGMPVYCIAWKVSRIGFVFTNRQISFRS
jgi:hypothetical protein